jgi:hypothetical protein
MSEGEQQVQVQKTAEELKRQQELEAAERAKVIASRVPNLKIDGLDQSQLQSRVRELYDVVCRLEEEKYDWEFKLRKMDFEINELNIVVNDIKGHFVKPMLKKISKTEQKLAKIAEVKSKLQGAAFRENLKSTGQSKFALDEKDDTGKKPDWGQDSLKHKDEEGLGGEEAAPDQEEEEEEEEEEE